MMLELPLTTLGDVDVASVTARTWAQRAGAPKQVQWELALITSEAGSNAVLHGGGGHATLTLPEPRTLRLEVVDHGPGIGDVAAALVDGYSKGSRVSLGCGLGAIQRLSDVFELRTLPGSGTTLIAVKRF
ncbi:MAG TPA: ATP-binding protein [Polyangiaceae bacterium]